MLLEGKSAVIYGGGGKVGGAVAFMASDLAGTTTGTAFNLTSGTYVD
jgi:enoyl-[acyl-carrier-protein] reductase (NADH)